jgi:hypothetical protein
MTAKAGLQAAAVDRLHDEDQVRPVQMLGRQGLVRIGGQAGGGRLDARPVGKHPLRRGGAQAIAGTEEEEVGQGASCRVPTMSDPVPKLLVLKSVIGR